MLIYLITKFFTWLTTNSPPHREESGISTMTPMRICFDRIFVGEGSIGMGLELTGPRVDQR